MDINAVLYLRQFLSSQFLFFPMLCDIPLVRIIHRALWWASKFVFRLPIKIRRRFDSRWLGEFLASQHLSQRPSIWLLLLQHTLIGWTASFSLLNQFINKLFVDFWHTHGGRTKKVTALKLSLSFSWCDFWWGVCFGRRDFSPIFAPLCANRAYLSFEW